MSGQELASGNQTNNDTVARALRASCHGGHCAWDWPPVSSSSSLPGYQVVQVERRRTKSEEAVHEQRRCTCNARRSLDGRERG